MKAQKVAAAAAFAVVLTQGAAPVQPVYAEDQPQSVQIAVETAVADSEGEFYAAMRLDGMPDTGLSALEFAVAYDTAAVSITEVELLYDTGAQTAEIRVHPDFAGTVFNYEIREGLVHVRWVTALTDPEYWLRDEVPMLMLHGTLTDDLEAGGRTALTLIPAPRTTGTGEEIPGEAIAAGYLDAEGNVFQYPVSVTDGAVLKPVDERGTTLCGDVNLDGVCNAADAVLMARAAAEECGFSAAAYANADCDADGILTVGDLTLMLRVLTENVEEAGTD